MNYLKNHPFAVEAHFDRSIVLTFAIQKDLLQNLLPECLQLDTFEDRWAFIAVAMVQTRQLRPKGFPTFFGNNFFLIGYRIFVRYLDQSGKRLRGLYILKSETDKKKMEILGNIFTHYKYSTTDISVHHTGNHTSISSQQSNFHLHFNRTETEANLPSKSPFTNWKEARKFAGPLPFTFTYQAATKSVLIIEGVRQNWKPKPISVCNYHFEYLDSLNLSSALLASAFEIENIPYYWKKGRIEKWT